jgi:hypothetical protein
MEPSMSGATYAMLIVDEFSGYSWGYFLQTKGQAAERLMEFVTMRDREKNFIQTIRSDQGGEFSSNLLKGFLREKGIKHSMGPAYTPQYQGKVERMNRTVGEMAHAIRIAATLNVSFWQLAWETAIFLRNRSPSVSNQGSRTPYQVLTGKLPRLENLLIFGCRAEAHIDAGIRRKGEDKSRPGLFVGYDEASRAYKFLPDGARKWVAVRSLICDQNLVPPICEATKESWEIIEIASEAKQQPLEIAESKQEEKEQIQAAKSTRMLTRSQSKLNGHTAMVGVDEFGGEHYIPSHGIGNAVPKTITGAFMGPEAKEWKQAVEEEMQAINEAQTLSDPVELPEGVKAVQLKFIFTRKVGEDGQIQRYKARLVYNHLGDAIEEEDNYSPVANKVSLRVFLTAVASQGWCLCQADVKTAFLNADNPGKEFVRLPKEVVEHEHQRVRVLLKALYGLQRAPKMWHQTFATWAISVGFGQSDHDQCLFMHSNKQQMLILYVDDLLLAAENEQLLGEMCELLNGKFQSRVMGTPNYFLGMNIKYNQQERLVLITQQTYIEAIVQKYGFETLLPRTLPMVPGAVLECADDETIILENTEMCQNFGSLVGALLYLAVCTRPDISFSVGILSKFVSKPGKAHWDAAINLLGYLKGLFVFKWVPSRDNIADMFTKALRAARFKWLVGTVVTSKFCKA